MRNPLTRFRRLAFVLALSAVGCLDAGGSADDERSIDLLSSVVGGDASGPCGAGPFEPIRVASGQTTPVSDADLLWAADNGYTGGTAGLDQKSPENAALPAVYLGQRWGDFRYTFSVPSGTYNVKLLFTESYVNGPRQRLFSVAVNGSRYLEEFDIFAAGGGKWRPVDRDIVVDVTQGVIDIVFTAGSVQFPRVAAIEITASTDEPTTPIGAAQPTPPSQTPSGVVYRNGRDLMLDGAVYRFVGVNDFSLTGCHTGNPHSSAEMDAFFASLRPNTVTRTWAFESVGEEGIDRVIRSAEKYNQKVMLSLGEGAGHCGAPHYGVDWYRSGYTGQYFAWIRKLVPRYKDSPAVIWEIMNEPGQDSGGGMTQAEMKNFYHATAQLIKSLDPNHLVATGTLDSYQSWQEGQSGYADVHDSPYIDMMSVHEYEHEYNNNTGVVSRWGQNLAAAKQVDMPIYVGEFGIGKKNGCISPQERASVTRTKFDAYLDQEASGVLYWAFTSSPNNGDGDICDSLAANEPYGGPVFRAIQSYTHALLP